MSESESTVHGDWSPESARDLVQIISELHGRGWCPATSSNFSFRCADGSFVVSQSGVDKGRFTERDLMRVDPDGQALSAGKPSAETVLHAAIYQFDPEARSVLHTHSVTSTVLSMVHCDEAALAFTGYEILKGITEVCDHEVRLVLPIVPNSQDMQQLAAYARTMVGRHPEMKAFLIAGHGLYAWGRSLAEAKRHLEVVEFLLQCLSLRERYLPQQFHD